MKELNTKSYEKIICTYHLLHFIIKLRRCSTHVKDCMEGHVYGFWGGLWHGIVTPIAFIGSLFKDDIAVWAVNNNGGWYTFGFVLGVGALTGSITSSSDKK